MQPGFFDLNDRHHKLNERDPLIHLNELVDWEDFRSTLERIRSRQPKSRAGRKPFDVVLMFKACKGQIIDASFVNAPKQRNSREENARIKEGKTPERFEINPNVKRQKDTDARWTKKNGQSFYGYKNHVSVDNKHKLIRGYEVTSAEVHDSQIFYELLRDNTAKDIWADSAYSSEENELMLSASDYRSHIHKKGSRNKALSEREVLANYRKSKVRVRVEHVFGSMTNEQGGMFVRVIGLARAGIKIGMMNLVYNLRRFVTLSRKGLPEY